MRAVPAPVKVVLVEDNDVFRESLELLLGLRSDVEVVGSVAEGTEAVAATEQHRPDVVLMDYRLPGMDGVQATKAVRDANPGVAVVVLTGASLNPREADALYQAGAAFCLSKDQDLEAIVAAIGAAAAGATADAD